MSKIESYQNRFRSNFQEQGVEFQRHYLGLIQKENVSESSNKPSSRIHLPAMFNFSPIPLITLLCLQLCPYPSSYCCAFNFPHSHHHTVCLQFCPYPSSHCCAFNFPHTHHHTVVPSTLPTPFITLLCHTVLGSPVTCAEP